ncbi:hypothetical protein K1T71_003125 [Dendrolimus kikuchii]|uniref:Uncharacterized protein n=1 Tax=Dendrolimus kikuchii TaxID=765133 RepID=A0ACC1DB29_9NEOP|nr:hypothetical protein K1T71_003125 [Dendrolimus kikuchii]
MVTTQVLIMTRLPLVLVINLDVKSMAMLNNPINIMNGDSDTIIADYINSKGYIPKDIELPKSTMLSNVDTDVTYLLSKLSDEELIKVLNELPKKTEYNLYDILKTNYSPKSNQKSSYELPKEKFNVFEKQNYLNKRFQTVSDKTKPRHPVFRLENKEVNPFIQENGGDPKYLAVQKLHNLLYSRPQSQKFDGKNFDDEEKKEFLFDVLVAQLKTLCCKTNKSINKKDTSSNKSYQLKGLLKELIPRETLTKNLAMSESASNDVRLPREYVFLIINDEINSNGNDDLIYVDPESLERNSSVLLLGPITNQMTEAQLKLVMTRISNELSKAEYLPLLYQLSDGRLNEENIKLTDSLIMGPDTRRYIKPHRCNHKSKIAKIFFKYLNSTHVSKRRGKCGQMWLVIFRSLIHQIS